MRKLVLFDIDETMIKSYGVGRRSLTSALSTLAGFPVDSSSIALSGKTDPQICVEILTANGLSIEKLDGGLAKIYETYLPILEQEIRKSSEFGLHEGVEDLLKELSCLETVHLALLTGNIEPGARLKLNPFSLNHYFATGAFGSDAADRMHLPAIACKRCSEHFVYEFAPEDVVIVGDSVNDVRCAKGFGARSIAVATGKTPWDDIRACDPDFLFPSLADTESVLQAITG